jgi:hypothetical protein
MARRFVELITSDLSGEQVEDATICSFVWDGTGYELDYGPSEEPEKETVARLIEVARVTNVKPAKKATPSATLATVPSRPVAHKRAAQSNRKGRIKGAPSFSPAEYFAMFGKLEPSGRRHWTCPICATEVSIHGEPDTNAVSKFRQHIVDNHENKLLWVIAAKRRHKVIPAGYEDRG